jgi:competence protein ComEA
LNEATPPWRAFSSDAPDPAAPEPAAGGGRTVPRWLVPLLATLGGLTAGAALAGVLVVALGMLPAGSDRLPFPETAALAQGLDVPPTAATPPAKIVVDVAGAVVRPGLHRLGTGARVGDAIEAAGGFAPRADLGASSQALNLAQRLEDGAKVLVPELGIDRPGPVAAAADDGRIDLNRADQSELESLPGIGPVTARKILDAREDERFGGVPDLRSRGLVGESVYEDIEGLVRAS